MGLALSQHKKNLGCIRGAGSVTAAMRRGPGTALPPGAGMGEAAVAPPRCPLCPDAAGAQGTQGGVTAATPGYLFTAGGDRQ